MLGLSLLHRSLFLTAVLLGASALGQSIRPSGQVPPQHWAVQAAARLEALGLTERYLPAQNAIPVEVLRQVFDSALLQAQARAPDQVAVAAAYRDRFNEEFASRRLGANVPIQLQGGALAAGGLGREVTLGTGVPPTHMLPVSGVPERWTPSLRAAGWAGVTPWIGLAAEPQFDELGLDMPHWEALVGWHDFALSIGRAVVSYGLQGERSFVMSGAQPLNRLELQTLRPFRLPFFLRHIGDVSVQAFLARLDDPRHQGEPFLWGADVRVQPHPRLTLSLQRGVMIGGGAREERLTPAKFLKMVFATKNQLENNVMALSMRWRLPTEAALPLTGYAEWGADDLGAQFKAPGILLGLHAPSLPGLPEVSTGAEFAFMGAVCCRTFQWYAHHIQQGGWVASDAPLGHPLGGDGREYRLYGAADLLGARLRLRADVFLRQRFVVNLYSPFRGGTGVGGSSTLTWRISPRGELGFMVAQELGRGWRNGELEGRAAFFF